MEWTVPSPAVLLPRPGDVVCNKYRIEAVLGRGGMGIVMSAVDTSLGRHVAIKFLAPHKASADGAVARFLREARAAAAIQSEHVVRVFEVDTFVAGTPFIVMEHLVGADLAHLLEERGPLAIDEACDAILQACQALAEAHGLGIVHRDLKPGNLFRTLRPDGSSSIKVLDFGISKAVDDGTIPSLTATGVVMGTPQYMSPEQVRSLRDVDARADIWALGSILFELLTQSAIFDAPTSSALCAMIAMDPPIPLRARLPTAPPELEAAILRCLHKDPAARFQDVAGLADALAPFASDSGRLSAAVVAKVVRGTLGAATVPSPMTPRESSLPPTIGVAESRVPARRLAAAAPAGSLPPPLAPAPAAGWSYPGGYGPSLLPSAAPSAPSLHHPTTQSVWQQSGAGEGGSPGHRSSGLTAAILGVSAVVVLGAAAGGYVIVKRKAGVAKVASAASRPADAGASPAGSPPAPALLPVAPAEPSGGESPEVAARGKEAEQNCSLHTTSMGLATSAAARKRAATDAKAATCHGGASSRCERQVCLNACTFLHDQPCIQQIRRVIDQGPAAQDRARPVLAARIRSVVAPVVARPAEGVLEKLGFECPTTPAFTSAS